MTSDTVTVELPKDLVEKVGYLMHHLNDDDDYWTLYWACLVALSRKDN